MFVWEVCYFLVIKSYTPDADCCVNMTDFDRLCVLSTHYFRVTCTRICVCRKETSLDLVQRKGRNDSSHQQKTNDITVEWYGPWFFPSYWWRLTARAATLSAALIQLWGEIGGVWESTRRVAGETINLAVQYCCYNSKEEHRWGCLAGEFWTNMVGGRNVTVWVCSAATGCLLRSAIEWLNERYVDISSWSVKYG
jgi:hypothetical protein